MTGRETKHMPVREMTHQRGIKQAWERRKDRNSKRKRGRDAKEGRGKNPMRVRGSPLIDPGVDQCRCALNLMNCFA